jgi:hypothetical protein
VCPTSPHVAYPGRTPYLKLRVGGEKLKRIKKK